MQTYGILYSSYVASYSTLMLMLTVPGYLYITGRIKEILITRGGENVAPVPIEEKVLDILKLLSYCITVGDNQKFLTMLVTLRCEVSKTNITPSLEGHQQG